MPLPPLAPNNTARYIISYTANGHDHDVSFRYDDAGAPLAPPVLFLAEISVILIAAQGLMPTDWSLNTARYIPSGSTVSITTGLPPVLPTGAATVVPGQAPGFMTWVGRSAGGRQARMFLLGAALDPSSGAAFLQDYRVLGSESVAIQNVRDALDISSVVAIDNQLPNWYNYANIGFNAYWQKALRP